MKSFNIEAFYKYNTRLSFEDNEIGLEFSFNRYGWFMNISYGDTERNGIFLTTGNLLLNGSNLPFDFLIDSVYDGVNPFAIDSFSSGDFTIYIVEREELKELRGYDVK